AQLGALVEPEDGLGVADVGREQARHRHYVSICRGGGLCPLPLAGAREDRLDYRSSSLGSASPIFSASVSAVSFGSSPSPRSSSTVTSLEVHTSARGMMRVGRFLSHTQTSSIRRWKKG